MARSPSNGSPLLALLFALFIAFPAFVLSQELSNEIVTDNASTQSVGSLDRRTRMFIHALKNDGGFVVEGSGLGVFDAFFASLSMIIVSEIGDETFIIAALMAMRHPKSIVLSGALTALFVMTVLSTGLGRIVPNLISRKHTNNAATVLYAFFGLRLLYIAWRSGPKSSQKKEMEEVEEKLESGQGKSASRRFFSRFCTPIFLESFILTFLAEWACDPQKRCWSGSGSNNRPHNMYIPCCGGWEHACFKDLTTHCCNYRGLAVSRIFPLIVFLSATMK
ncbi:Gdt1 family protein [Dioscorea alata]|uniref:Gdt1 family protein n=1 Tax=Dioscorea alata TaxID=55571 RepID=A0ACB7WAF1_DIOAL|nr:Gdt1 family protein [Dioscorea alata]